MPKPTPRLDAQHLLYDECNLLRPLGEIDVLLSRARAPKTTRQDVFRTAARRWRSDPASKSSPAAQQLVKSALDTDEDD